MHRHEITDRQRALVAPLLPGKSTDGGVTARGNRPFFNAVAWLLRTGAAWAGLPERFGKPNAVCRRFRRLAQKKGREAVFEALEAPGFDRVMLDSTVLRAHQRSAGQKKAPRSPRAWGAAGAG